MHPRLRQVLIATATAIVVLDLSQPLLLEWRPKFFGALAGAAIYAGVALGAARTRSPIPLVVAALMPLIPLSVLAAWALSLPVPTPDAPMLGILVLQLVASGCAIRLRFG